MSSQPIMVIATFNPLPERASDLRDLLGTMLEPTRQEPGCRRYDLYRSDDAEPALHLIESYDDADALAAHRASDHYVQYRAKLPELLASPVEVTVLTPDDVASDQFTR